MNSVTLEPTGQIKIEFKKQKIVTNIYWAHLIYASHSS